MKCPQCGGEMIPSPAPEVRQIARGLIQGGATPAYAQNFAETQHEKQAELGVIQTCPNCRYVTREKAAAPRTSKAAA
jgi:predicted RNA-binding Zn-ribbon protein involved in translation (DUF1610 family)